MKTIAIVLSSLALLKTFCTNAQCLENSDFNQFSGNLNPSSTGCPFISSDNTVNWQKSHGSPQIFIGAFPQYYAYMWAASTQGTTSGGWHVAKHSEGMFASYAFVQNQVYKIKMSVKTQGEAVGFWGTNDIEEKFHIYAANNIVVGPEHCGDEVPTISSKQLIATESFVGTSWTIFEYDFVPSQNYSQIWIYPELTFQNSADNNAQYDFYIDYLQVCPPESCAGSVTYNLGSLPINDTKHGFINIGSSFGGFGTVTTNLKTFTTMRAAQQIDIAPDFKTPNFQLSSGFQAIIEPCVVGDQKQSLEPYTDNVELLGGQMQLSEFRYSKRHSSPLSIPNSHEFEVYPNPSTNKINVSFLNNKKENVTIKIRDTYGSLLYSFSSHFDIGKNLYNFDVSALPNGLYFVEVRFGKENQFTRKVAIVK